MPARRSKAQSGSKPTAKERRLADAARMFALLDSGALGTVPPAITSARERLGGTVDTGKSDGILRKRLIFYIAESDISNVLRTEPYESSLVHDSEDGTFRVTFTKKPPSAIDVKIGVRYKVEVKFTLLRATDAELDKARIIVRRYSGQPQGADICPVEVGKPVKFMAKMHIGLGEMVEIDLVKTSE